jgi:hypothetical protein
MSPFEETDRAIKNFYSKCKLAMSSDGKRYRTNIPRVDPVLSKTNKEKLKKYLDDKSNKIFIKELIRKCI